jgi:hypothetical protein
MPQRTLLLPPPKSFSIILTQDTPITLLLLKDSNVNFMLWEQEHLSGPAPHEIAFFWFTERDRGGCRVRGGGAEYNHVGEVTTVSCNFFSCWGSRFAIDAAGRENRVDCVYNYTGGGQE